MSMLLMLLLWPPAVPGPTFSQPTPPPKTKPNRSRETALNQITHREPNQTTAISILCVCGSYLLTKINPSNLDTPSAVMVAVMPLPPTSIPTVVEAMMVEMEERTWGQTHD